MPVPLLWCRRRRPFDDGRMNIEDLGFDHFAHNPCITLVDKSPLLVKILDAPVWERHEKASEQTKEQLARVVRGLLDTQQLDIKTVTMLQARTLRSRSTTQRAVCRSCFDIARKLGKGGTIAV